MTHGKNEVHTLHCNLHILTSSHYRLACSIPDPDTDTVLVTGGRDGRHSLTTVSRYGKEEWIEDFSSELRTGRYAHGCSSFLSKDNEKVVNKSYHFGVKLCIK